MPARDLQLSTRDQRRHAGPDDAVPAGWPEFGTRGGGASSCGRSDRASGARSTARSSSSSRSSSPRSRTPATGSPRSTPRWASRSPSRRSASAPATRSSSRRTRSSPPPARPCMLGAIPVFVDVDPETLLIDPALIDAAVTTRTRGDRPGPPRRIAGRHGRRDGRGAARTGCGSSRTPPRRTARRGAAGPVGAIGDIGVFSFQSTKPINAGEGGMMVTDDDELDELLWSYPQRRPAPGRRVVRARPARLEPPDERVPGRRPARPDAADAGAAATPDRGRARTSTSACRQIPGVVPLKIPEGVTAHSWYTYHWRWLGAADGGLPKTAFAEALRAEGIPLFQRLHPVEPERRRSGPRSTGSAAPIRGPARTPSGPRPTRS